MLEETLDLYMGEEKITLKRYIKFLVSIFKEGGIKTAVAFVLMQICRVVMFAIITHYCTNLSPIDELIYGIIITVVIWPLEVLMCWQFSVKCKKFIFGQLTGRP